MQIRIAPLFLVAFLCSGATAGFAAGETEVPEITETIGLPVKNDPVAVFTTPKTLWVVTGSATSVSPDSIQKTGAHFIMDAKQYPAQNGNVLTFSLNAPLSASVEKTDTGIQVILSHGEARPAQVLRLSLANRQTAVTVETKTGKSVVSFADPLTGTTLRIIPISEPGTGFYPARHFSKFGILPSAQGLVIKTPADDVTVALNNSGEANISSPLGLKLSKAAIEQLSNANEMQSGEMSSDTLFPYANWKLSDEKNYVSVAEKLFHDITYGNSEAANRARLRLLNIYLSEGLFAEAEGMANDILRNSYKFYRANKVAAMRGAALFFMQHTEEAARDFSSPELAGDKEMELWQGLCREVVGADNGQFAFVDNYDRYISKYPPPFIRKLALLAADFEIKHHEYDRANEIFELLTKNSLDEPIHRYIEYMRAEIFSETGREDEAERIWSRQADLVDDPLVRSSAEFSLVNMLIREDRITPQKAIKRLDKLRIVWRGDDLELSVLTLLGNLYIDQKEYDKALHTLREIVQYFPDSPQAVTTSAKMEQIFTMLYNKGGADTMPPLDALTLFYEFRDLVPSGKDGDMMVRNLADRLVGIDLLDRAEELLNHQVQERLQGYERSRIGARLAAIYLQNHQPKDALSTLETTGYGELPSDLELTRQRLTAKALAAQGQAEKAIEVINNDNSAEGVLLRLSIYWETKDWPNVTRTAEEVLSNRTDPSAPLTRQESGVLLKLATAYVYEHDSGQIQYLRDYFTPLLKNNPDKPSFLFITSESGSTDYSNVANADADIGTIKTYVDDARAQAKKDMLK